MKILVISSLLILLLLLSSTFLLTSPVKAQESIDTINCSFENPKLT